MRNLRSSRSLGLVSASLLFCLGAGSCGSGSTSGPGDPGTPTDPITHIYAKSTTQLTIEVDYQVGAEPYTGMLINMDTWNLFKVNADKLFNGQKTLTVPSMLVQMEGLSDITGTSFTSEQLQAIAAQHRNITNSTGVASFYFVFLNGYFNDGKMVRNDVLGVSLGDTGILAMFKPVIQSSSNNSNVRKFVEQSTLVHEFGHAVGLVNNGIPMVTPHQDTANGAHDSNSKCVMYYQNEGPAAAAAYTQTYILTGNEVLFDTNCLADTAARLASAQ